MSEEQNNEPSQDQTEQPRRWNPLRDLSNLRDNVNRVLEQGLASVSGSPTIAIDIYETETAVIVRTSPLGNIQADDIDVSITGDTLTIRGEIKADAEVDETNFLRRERRFGSFQRSVTIPRPIKAEETIASFENGILTITIPKTEEATPRVIRVSSSEE